MTRAEPVLPFSVLGLWLAGLGAAAQYGKVSVTYPMLADLYGAHGAALGFAVSLVGFVGVIFGVTAGLISARFGHRRTLLVALVLGAAVSAWQATLPGFSLFLVSRAIEGASHLAIVVAAPTLIAEISNDRQRGLALSLWSTFFGVAFAVLVWAGLPFARVWGPGALYGAHGIWMALMAGLVAVLLPRDVVGPRGHLSFGEVMRDHARIYASPRLSAPALGWLCYAASWVAILTVMPARLPEGTRDWVAGTMPLAGIATSMTIGVYLLRRFPAITVLQGGFLLSAASTVAIWAAPDAPAPYLALALSLGLVQGPSFAAVPQLNLTPKARAEANGALAQMGNLGNTLGTPILAALMVGGGLGGFLVFGLALYLCGFFLHMALARRRRRGVV